LFLPHKVEQDNPKLDVPDEAFENLFNLFGRYSWNLDDTPGGKTMRLTPDVLGYIFEKYINPTTTFDIDTRTFSGYLFLSTHHSIRRQRMLPACRTAGEPFTIPQVALTRSAIDAFLDELRGFHTAFRACFTRQEPRDQFFNYMVGQFSPLARKSIEPMALQVEGGKVRAMQRLVSDALWDEDAMLET
jgi:hypothetical protein